MNKMKYIQPKLSVVKVEINPLLQSSTPGYNPTKNFGDESSVGARQGWFDDGDDDE